MDVRKESHVAAALKYIEENLPVGEEGLYGLVNNAGVSFINGGINPLVHILKEGYHQIHDFVRCVSVVSLIGRLGVRYLTLSLGITVMLHKYDHFHRFSPTITFIVFHQRSLASIFHQ